MLLRVTAKVRGQAERRTLNGFLVANSSFATFERKIELRYPKPNMGEIKLMRYYPNPYTYSSNPESEFVFVNHGFYRTEDYVAPLESSSRRQRSRSSLPTAITLPSSSRYAAMSATTSRLINSALPPVISASSGSL